MQKGSTMSTNPLARRALAAFAAAGWLVAGCLAVVAVRSWRASRKTSTEMHAAFTAGNNVIKQASQREEQRDAGLAKNVTQLARAALDAQTPAAIAARLPGAFLRLPRPISISFAPPTLDRSDHAAQPEAPVIMTVPQPDLRPLLDQLDACRACAERLAVAQQDLQDERTKVSALTAERNAAAQAARGGGFWKRFRLGTKWFLIGGAAGALAVSATRR
jgi:hypothetical protein